MAIDSPIHTSEGNLPRVLAAGLPVLLEFWSRACSPCEQLAPVLDELARQYAGRALVVKVNSEEEPGLVSRYGVTRLPALFFIKDNHQLAAAAGASGREALAEWLDYLIQGGPAAPPLPVGPSVALPGLPAAPTQRPGAAPEHHAEPRPADSAGAGGEEPLTLTDATFDRVIQASPTPVLVDCWAAWCGPCKTLAPVVDSLAREYAGRVLVAKLNVDDCPATASRFGVMSIPTLLIFRAGQVVDRVVGAVPAQVLRGRLNQNLRVQ